MRVSQPKISLLFPALLCLAFMRLSRCNCCYQGCATTGTILGEHQIELNMIVGELADLAVHQIMELGVEAVHGTINADLKLRVISFSA